MSYQEALTRAGGLTAIAALFGASVWYVAGEEAGLEWFAGYLVEQSLSVDNLFVFILLFEFFKVPNDLQTRVLNWGIYGAMVMRGIMVALGAATISRYHEVCAARGARAVPRRSSAAHSLSPSLSRRCCSCLRASSSIRRFSF